MYSVIIYDSGRNIEAITRCLQSTGIENFYTEHIICTTDRGDQDLGYEITFETTDKSLVDEVLSHHFGNCCEAD